MNYRKKFDPGVILQIYVGGLKLMIARYIFLFKFFRSSKVFIFFAVNYIFFSIWDPTKWVYVLVHLKDDPNYVFFQQ